MTINVTYKTVRDAERDHERLKSLAKSMGWFTTVNISIG